MKVADFIAAIDRLEGYFLYHQLLDFVKLTSQAHWQTISKARYQVLLDKIDQQTLVNEANLIAFLSTAFAKVLPDKKANLAFLSPLMILRASFLTEYQLQDYLNDKAYQSAFKQYIREETNTWQLDCFSAEQLGIIFRALPLSIQEKHSLLAKSLLDNPQTFLQKMIKLKLFSFSHLWALLRAKKCTDKTAKEALLYTYDFILNMVIQHRRDTNKEKPYSDRMLALHWMLKNPLCHDRLFYMCLMQDAIREMVHIPLLMEGSELSQRKIELLLSYQDTGVAYLTWYLNQYPDKTVEAYARLFTQAEFYLVDLPYPLLQKIRANESQFAALMSYPRVRIAYIKKYIDAELPPKRQCQLGCEEEGLLNLKALLSSSFASDDDMWQELIRTIGQEKANRACDFSLFNFFSHSPFENVKKEMHSIDNIKYQRQSVDLSF